MTDARPAHQGGDALSGMTKTTRRLTVAKAERFKESADSRCRGSELLLLANRACARRIVRGIIPLAAFDGSAQSR